MSNVSQSLIWGVIVGMGVINLTLRFVPMAIVQRLELPPIVTRWLSFVPISVMGALVAKEVLLPGDRFQQPLTSPGVWAAVLTMLVFRFTRSFLGATVAGMLSFVILRGLIG